MAASSSKLTQKRQKFALTYILLTLLQGFENIHCNDFMVDDMKLNQDQLPTQTTDSSIFKSAIEGREYRWIDKVMPYKIDASLKDWTALIESTISYLNQMFCGCFYIR